MQWEIAQELGISQQAVSKLLRRVDRRIVRELHEDAQLLKARQVRRLSAVYEEAMRLAGIIQSRGGASSPWRSPVPGDGVGRLGR